MLLTLDVPATKSAKSKSENQLLDEATKRLLKAVKLETSKKGKPLRRADLLKQGYSERFIAKLEEA
jgi:hypothetical protein